MKNPTPTERVCVQLKPELLDFLDTFEDSAKAFPEYRFNEYPTRAAVARLAIQHFKHFIERCRPLLEEGLTFDEAERAIHTRRAWWKVESEAEQLPADHTAEIVTLSRESQK